MASTYIGKAPLTLVPTLDGTAHYVYRGRPAPEGIVPADLVRLVDEGFLEKVGGTYEDAVVDFVHEDPLVEAGLVRRPRSVVDQVPEVEALGERIAATPVVGAVDPATGQPVAPPAADAPPPKTGKKELWVDFRVAQHGEEHRDVLDGLTKDELQDDDAVDAALQPAQD